MPRRSVHAVVAPQSAENSFCFIGSAPSQISIRSITPLSASPRVFISTPSGSGFRGTQLR